MGLGTSHEGVDLSLGIDGKLCHSSLACLFDMSFKS